jgi:type IV pilus assembly protein PilA
MFKQLKSQKGFTLIELMIVVAIIGILAAIAIPNFLTYQLKSRQSEAKVNLGAIKTSLIAFQAERGCFLGIPSPVLGVAAPVGGTKTVGVAWPSALLYPASAAGTVFCQGVGAVFTGTFTDIGFIASGVTNFRYATGASVLPAPIAACQGAPAVVATGTAVGGEPGVLASATSNLDGDANLSIWGASSDQGSQDCTIGIY